MLATTSTTPPIQTESKDGKSANQGSKSPTIGAPESYTPFKVPEGRELDAKVVDRATPIFRELGLSQDNAQKLVDFYNEVISEHNQTSADLVKSMREGWVKQINEDKEMGGKLDTIKADLGRAYTHLPPDLIKDFKAAMDLTGAGDHPAFVKAFWKLAQLVNEGTHVSGSGPSKHGQAAPETNSRPSLAAAMYPTLPSSR